MSREAIVISRGLHGPWNMGEVVLARNFAKILSELYDDVSIISSIDERRGKLDLSDSERQGLNIIFRRNEGELICLLKSELRYKPHADVHFANASIQRCPEAIWRREGDTYLYEFAYRILNLPGVTIKAFGALALSQLSNLKVITTSLNAYKNLGKLFRRNYYFVPAPLEIPPLKHLEQGNKDSFLRVIYLGHGNYSRLPYFEVLKALRRLNADGYDVKLKAYISKQGYVDYMRFIKGFDHAISKLCMNEFVRICVANLTEYEKYEVLANSDILLFPTLTNAAIDPPLVVLEAMALACCVIATPFQSIPHILRSDRGVIIKRHNLEAEIYNALKMLADEPQRLKEYATNARQWVMSTHSLSVVHENMKRMVGNTCARKLGY